MSTEPKAWHCPNCNAYHAPHVDTCPRPLVPLYGGQTRGTVRYNEALDRWELKDFGS